MTLARMRVRLRCALTPPTTTPHRDASAPSLPVSAGLTACWLGALALLSADAVLEMVLAYGMANHTLAQAAAATQAAATQALTDANSNRTTQISEYNGIKMRLTTTSITWTESQELHQAVVNQAQALKAKSLVAIEADGTKNAADLTLQAAQANYTALAGDAEVADQAVASAQTSRDQACSALTFTPPATFGRA